MPSAEFEIEHEVMTDDEGSGWRLCFQWGVYRYDDAAPESGYRFIWRKPDAHLEPARGQARIPSAATMLDLLRRASDAGWFVTCERGRAETATA